MAMAFARPDNETSVERDKSSNLALDWWMFLNLTVRGRRVGGTIRDR